MNKIARMYRLAMEEARRRNPGASDADLEEEGFVDEVLDDWSVLAGEEVAKEDSPSLERGAHNCDTWGTGEGQFHGRF